MASGIRIGGIGPGTIAQAADFQKFLESYPAQVVADTRAALETGADKLVEVIKAAAPVNALEPHPGALRDSVHKEAGRHDLSVLVIEDARDEKGEAFAAHVEQGHKTPEGGHVAPAPHFWPAVRDSKRKIAAQIRASMKRAAKGAPP